MTAELRGVILDIDGTLIASNEAHARAWVDALAEHGYNLPYHRVHALIGMGGDKLLPELTGILKDSPEGEAIGKRRRSILMERYIEEVRPTPGVRPLLERMRADGLRLVIATSANPDELEQLLKISGVADLIEEETTSGDVEASKPDPDIVQAALAKLDLSPDEVLMLGDTPFDIQAAGKCGIGVIGLRTGGHDADLADALAVYTDPADLLAHYHESPLGRGLKARERS